MKSSHNKIFYFDGGPKSHNLKYYTKYVVLFFMDFVWKAILAIRRPKHTPKKYHLSLCSIFRDEAPFLKEWIEYHLLVGVEHFYLYNNFSKDNCLEVLQPYIDNGTVTLTDWPQMPAQKEAYRHFFGHYSNETDWVSFIDIDEFLCPLKADNVSEWLSKFQSYPVVMFYWKMFCSSGLENHNYAKTCIEQYTSCFPQLHDIGKIFFNTDYPTPSDNVEFNCIHSQDTRILGINVPPVNQFGYFVKYGTHRFGKGSVDFQCNHYWSKAVDLFQQKAQHFDAVWGGKRKDMYNLYHEYEAGCTMTDNSIQRFLPELKKRLPLI